ncbi:MAG: tetratricopeptide repeat protein [Novosphingobium sp.]
MRYTPAALALALAFGLTSSVLYSAPPMVLEPRAAALQAEGKAALQAGNFEAAIDAFEAGLAMQPGSVLLTLDLAEATRRQGLQGKAIHYYRKALVSDPQNLDAIAGEGAALVEKGAVEKARRNLTRLEGLCGKSCAQSQLLSAAIAKGPSPRVLTAEAVKPSPSVSEN